MHKSVPGRYTLSSSKLETTQIFINRMDKISHAYNETFYSNEKGQTIDTQHWKAS